MRSTILTLLFLTVVSLLLSCSGISGDVVVPPANERIQSTEQGNHMIWGLYQFTADPVNKTLDITPIRTTQMHLNALPFLEPPLLVNLTLESLIFNGDIIEAEIGLRHPFIGLTEFTGFDVCGILITNGSYSGFDDSNIRHAGPGDTYLMNPDGHSRWWNPSEFPVNTGTMFGYNDGLLGTPDSVANFNSTINGYKYFCDDLLDPDGPLTDITLEKRGMFSAGQKNIRHYTIKLGAGGLIFNYAIDASWEFPQGSKPWKAPDSFGMNANRVEPWCISITETSNTLAYYDGQGEGGISLLIDVYDWVNPGTNAVYVEAANGVILKTGPIPASGGGEGYSTYEVDIYDASPTAPGDLAILITVETEQENFQNFIQGTNTSAYLIHPTTVSDEPVVVHTVTGIFPAYGKPDYLLEDVEVYGSNFMDGGPLAVKLRKSGEPDVVATNVTFEDENTITCDINIPSGTALGLWDVEVTNGNNAKADGDELFEIFDCGTMTPSTTGGYIVTSPPGTMFGEWCGVTCTRQGTSYLIATGPIHNTFAAIQATANGGSSEYQAPAGGYLNYDLTCTSDNTIYYTHDGNPSMVFQISFDPGTGFGSYSAFASIDAKWIVYRICVDDNDNPIVLADEIDTHDNMKVCHWNGSGWDETNLPNVIIGVGDKYVQDFDYNPVLGHYVFTCIDASGYSINMYAMDKDGNVAHQDLDVFDWNNDFWYPGIYIDQDDAKCHIFLWGGDRYSGAWGQPRPSARFDAFYGAKAGANMPTTFNHGPGGGKGAWAPGTNRLFTPAMGGNVISWFTLPGDW